MPDPIDEEGYEIISIGPIKPPADMDGVNWHCYVIAQGKNTIRGYRQGNLRSVTESVEEIVVRLNERRMGKRGRVHLDMTQQRKPAKSK